ncbi:MAG: hypothetical protein LBL33_02020 [Tannerella sp.]|jgi:hypothetical protein|nr:hypothetical protein [Tannerella sp.]
MTVYFQYGKKEVAYLKKADRRLAEVICQTDMIQRLVIPDLFAAFATELSRLDAFRRHS